MACRRRRHGSSGGARPGSAGEGEAVLCEDIRFAPQLLALEGGTSLLAFGAEGLGSGKAHTCCVRTSGQAEMARVQGDERDEAARARPPCFTKCNGSYRRSTPGIRLLACAMLLGAVGTEAAGGLGPVVLGKGRLLAIKLPFMSGKAVSALKSKGMAFQWQSFQKVAGGFVSMRADVTSRFQKNWEVANENWCERTETLVQMAPAPFVTDAVKDSSTATAPRTSAQREEEQQAEAARKAGLSEYQYRHMMRHYKTLRPKTYLQKMQAETEAAMEAAAESASGEAEDRLIGANAKEEIALGKRREKIHESRRLRHHTKNTGTTMFPHQ
eukprot:CAMPEP_0173471106 /NCGR_PEP_ID=MMETSP1357-20121228/78225_1 /TAXON_ID=77926 /ORGANISM="Hemiselmis rufescens, Strain PCC563" /LENGTH=326 /DNA_ID=CAMNT_0014439409 /DNA_START=342 /DNA_END=1323 /DNA_ORIENTATION=-